MFFCQSKPKPPSLAPKPTKPPKPTKTPQAPPSLQALKRRFSLEWEA